MPTINFDEIVTDSLTEIKAIFGSAFKKAKPFAEHAIQQFAEDAAFLAKLRLASKIDDAELKERLKMQELAAKNVFLTIKGIGLIAAQDAINAVIGIVFKALKSSLNIALPI